MGLIGGLFMFGGMGAVLLGVIGIIVGLFTWDIEGVIMSAFLAAGGLLFGTIGTAILE